MIEHALMIAAPAALVLAMVRIVLTAQPAPGTRLPHPSKIGLPSGGLALPSQVHAALTGRKHRRS
jgi:hypothetical protein